MPESLATMFSQEAARPSGHKKDGAKAGPAPRNDDPNTNGPTSSTDPDSDAEIIKSRLCSLMGSAVRIISDSNFHRLDRVQVEIACFTHIDSNRLEIPWKSKQPYPKASKLELKQASQEWIDVVMYGEDCVEGSITTKEKIVHGPACDYETEESAGTEETATTSDGEEQTLSIFGLTLS
jgi:hypothetical protein